MKNLFSEKPLIVAAIWIVVGIPNLVIGIGFGGFDIFRISSLANEYYRYGIDDVFIFRVFYIIIIIFPFIYCFYLIIRRMRLK
jgi:hypothetical protein